MSDVELTNPEKLDITQSIPRNVLVFAILLEDSLLCENYTFYFVNREGGTADIDSRAEALIMSQLYH